MDALPVLLTNQVSVPAAGPRRRSTPPSPGGCGRWHGHRRKERIVDARHAGVCGVVIQQTLRFAHDALGIRTYQLHRGGGDGFGIRSTKGT